MFRLFTYLKAKLLHALLIVAAQLTANPGKWRDIFKGGMIENLSIYLFILKYWVLGQNKILCFRYWL